MTNRTFRALLLLSCWVAVAPAAADEGRTPIWQQTAITEPGSYVVTRNITAAGTVIDVQATGVTIDLNGFVLESTDPSVPVIRLRPSAADSTNPHFVSVHGGEVHGGWGIDAEGIPNLNIYEMWVATNVPVTTREGLRAALVEEANVRGSDFQGFGVYLQGGANALTGRVEDVQVRAAPGDCLVIDDGDGFIVKMYASDGCGNHGLNITNCDGCTIDGVRATGADVNGVTVDFSSGTVFNDVNVNGSAADNVLIGPFADGTYLNVVNSTGSMSGWGLNNLGTATRVDGANVTGNAMGGIRNEGSYLTATESASRNNGGPNFEDLGFLTYQAQNCFD